MSFITNKILIRIYHKIKFYFQVHFLSNSISRKLKYFKKINTIYKMKLLGDKDQYIIIEYPKCGRTWLRFMLHQAEAKKYHIPLINTIHEVYYSQFSLPRVNYIHGFKPELSLSQFHHNTHIKSPRSKGYILLVRNPIRVMISYYHQIKYRDQKYKGSINEFIKDPSYGIKKYIEYIDFYMNDLRNVNHIIIKYEDLIKDPFKWFKKVINFTELYLHDSDIDEIINNSTFDKMQMIEKNKKYKVGWLNPKEKKDIKTFKVRAGNNEKINNYFTKNDIDFLLSYCFKSKNLAELGYTDEHLVLK